MPSAQRVRRRTERAPRELRAPERVMLAPVVARFFESIEIAASVVTLRPRTSWHPIHRQGFSIIELELQHRREHARELYNKRSLDRARRERRSFVAEHYGFSDLFAPFVVGKDVLGVLVCGPFQRAHPTAASVVEQWRQLTGRKAVSDDPSFLQYLDCVLATTVLDEPALKALFDLTASVGRLVTGVGTARGQIAQATRSLWRVQDPSLHRRMARAVAGLVDQRSAIAWATRQRIQELKGLGLAEQPSDVAVLLAAGSERPTATALEQQFERLDWQRACAAAVTEQPGVACGKIAEFGVVFLAPPRGSAERRRAALMRLVEIASRLARQFHFEARAGIGPLGGIETLPERFKQCRAAAELALYRGVAFVEGSAEQPRSRPLGGLAELMHEVVEAYRLRPAQAQDVVDRYLSAVALRSSFSVSAARAYLDSMLAQVLRTLEAPTLGQRSVVESLLLELDETEAAGLADLLARYRRALSTLALVAERPTQADQQLRLRRAMMFLSENFTTPLRLKDAARAAGFAPAYFSRLFKRRYGVTFESYVLGLRLDRAKDLLQNTLLSVERVAEQSGFGSPVYFYQSFRRTTGTTPTRFRSNARTPEAERAPAPRRASGKRSAALSSSRSRSG